MCFHDNAAFPPSLVGSFSLALASKDTVSYLQCVPLAHISEKDNTATRQGITSVSLSAGTIAPLPLGVLSRSESTRLTDTMCDGSLERRRQRYHAIPAVTGRGQLRSADDSRSRQHFSMKINPFITTVTVKKHREACILFILLLLLLYYSTITTTIRLLMQGSCK